MTKPEAVQIGAIIYRAHFGTDRTKFQNQQGLINQLVPDDLLPDLRVDDWKKQILNAYSKRLGKIFGSSWVDLEYFFFVTSRAF